MPPVHLPFLLGPSLQRICIWLLIVPVAGHEIVQETYVTDGIVTALLCCTLQGGQASWRWSSSCCLQAGQGRRNPRRRP